ncbi:MAG: nucleotidyltransferase family protein [Calothrix sp. MO_167.B12]|nr:nucleotidyltransferase family protein [Calothrix sp. MO_167.B12]
MINLISSPVRVVRTQLENELLFCCARTSIDNKTAERIQVLLQEDINWSYLVDIAARHGVIPLLYKNLNNISPKTIPQNVLSQLQTIFHTNTAQNLFLSHELLKLLNLFEANGISAIPFKGPVLAAQAYGNVSLRTYCDLDILVREKDFLKAKDLLKSQGYCSTAWWFLTEAQEVAVSKDWGEYSLARNDNMVHIDLHSRLIAGYLFTLSADLNYFWQHLQPVSFLGKKVLSFRAEDLLLYLCIHGSKSFWEKLGWICDIAQLIQKHDIDWEELLPQAKTLGVERMLLLGCFLASNILGTNLPEKVQNKIDADAQIPVLAIQVNQRLRGETKYPCQKEYTLQSFTFHFQAMECLEDRLRYSLKCFITYISTPIKRLLRPTAKDRDFFPLPRSVYFLYYFLRPIRLLVQNRARNVEF